MEEEALDVFAELWYEYECCCVGAGDSLRVVRLHLDRVLAALSPVAARDAAGSQRH